MNASLRQDVGHHIHSLLVGHHVGWIATIATTENTMCQLVYCEETDTARKYEYQWVHDEIFLSTTRRGTLRCRPSKKRMYVKI